MSRINYGRVLIAGLVAGIVANAFDFVVNTYLMVDESAEMISRLNLNPAKVQGSMPVWIIVDFLWGLLLVFTYAAIRPRFGAGPKTAVIAGVTLWLGVTMTMAGFASMGILTQTAFIKGSALYLVSTMAASLAGGAVYKE
jgi:hypothetical protein